jgi:hypothetical protein
MKWSRGDRIAAVTLVVGVLALVAAWLVVPEFRKWSGLDRSEAQPQVEKKTISGVVVDRDTNRGVGQALVTVEGRTEQCITEDSGNFRIDLASDSPVRLRLRVSKSGFHPIDTGVEAPVDNLVLPLHRQ